MVRFGEDGFDRATIRGIAADAAVSPSLVRHHFGSKQGLREACDEHLVKEVGRLNARIQDSGAGAAGEMRPVPAFGRYQRYLARSLTEGAAAALFDELVRVHEDWLASSDACRTEPALADRTARAAVRAAISLSVTVLYDHIARTLAEDLTSDVGEARLMRAILDVSSHPSLTPEDARAAAAAIHASRTL